MSKAKTWLPLEANPDILTRYSHSLGLPSSYAFYDILGVEDWALDMIPKPLFAIVLLFPISKASESERQQSNARLSDACSYFMTQTVGNACGTVAVLHAMLNLHMDSVIISNEGSYVQRMSEATRSLSYSERGIWLENDSEIESAHTGTELLGQSAAPSDTGTEIDTHFVTFLLGSDKKTILELDGRRNGPISRGLCESPDEFASKVLKVIKTEFMDRNPEDIRFSLMGLA